MKDFPINFSMYQDVTTSHYDKSIYYVNMEDALANDYYLCAYLSNDIKELITSKTPEDYQGEVGFPWLDYFDEETYDGLAAAICIATSLTKAMNCSLLATKSVSQLTSTKTPIFPPA